MRSSTRRISAAGLILLAAISGACADTSPTGVVVPEQPAHSVSIAAATAWTASGPGTVTVVSDGTAGDAVMSYEIQLKSAARQEWTFETTADQAAAVTLPWSYSGQHGDSSGGATLQAVVNGIVVDTLVNAGVPGEFSFAGTYTFTVSAGDTYGFRFGGTTFDGGLTLSGTFTVDLPDGPGGPGGDPVTKDDCKDGGWEAFGFGNQGQCVAFVETGHDSR